VNPGWAEHAQRRGPGRMNVGASHLFLWEADCVIQAGLHAQRRMPAATLVRLIFFCVGGTPRDIQAGSTRAAPQAGRMNVESYFC
jgi:hypothetical protein